MWARMCVQKFRCAPLRIKKALWIFGPLELNNSNNNKNKNNYSDFLGPAFRVQKHVYGVKYTQIFIHEYR